MTSPVAKQRDQKLWALWPCILVFQTSQSGVLVYIQTRSTSGPPVSPIREGSDQVKPVSFVRNLGIYMDADVSMRSHA